MLHLLGRCLVSVFLTVQNPLSHQLYGRLFLNGQFLNGPRRVVFLRPAPRDRPAATPPPGI